MQIVEETAVDIKDQEIPYGVGIADDRFETDVRRLLFLLLLRLPVGLLPRAIIAELLSALRLPWPVRGRRQKG